MSISKIFWKSWIGNHCSNLYWSLLMPLYFFVIYSVVLKLLPGWNIHGCFQWFTACKCFVSTFILILITEIVKRKKSCVTVQVFLEKLSMLFYEHSPLTLWRCCLWKTVYLKAWRKGWTSCCLQDLKASLQRGITQSCK